MSDDPNDRGLSRKRLLSSVEASLRKMGTDYIDIFMIHGFDPVTLIEETMEAVSEQTDFSQQSMFHSVCG